MALITANYFNILPTDIIGIFINDCDIVTITNFFSTCKYFYTIELEYNIFLININPCKFSYMDKLQYYREIPQKYLTFKILRKISSLTMCRTIWKHQYTSKPIPITIFGLYTNIALNILNKFCFIGSCEPIYYSAIDNGTYRQIIFQNVSLINIYATYLDDWFIRTNIFDSS